MNAERPFRHCRFCWWFIWARAVMAEDGPQPEMRLCSAPAHTDGLFRKDCAYWADRDSEMPIRRGVEGFKKGALA